MIETGLAKIRIVLVEPAGPLNVGSIARVMKNMGLGHLVLVNPQCDPFGAEARQMAVHADDVLLSAQVVETLPEALKGCQRAIATTGRPHSAAALEPPRQALPWLLEPDQLKPDQNLAALIFGPEDRGLNKIELNYAQRFVYIPSNPDYPSLNLAQAVAICCYELSQLVQENVQISGEKISGQESGTGCPQNLPVSSLAPLDALEGYYQHLESVLLKIGYLYPHTANSRMQKFRRLFNRALPSSEEVALLRGILSQIEWAIEHGSARADDRSAP